MTVKSSVQLPNFQSRCENSLSTIRCTASEIETLIKLLNPTKATGPIAISNRMLKVVAKEVSFPLEILFKDDTYGQVVTIKRPS